ncbi:serine hydrolase domain-containing protein [Flavobacteriaceae bacterium 14752]|uniref:serine hydrolase domain-containing protein n=1 Tax=Mesohalobacter salilacus TaxID=2491711 RepID=UPI000F63E999|nr:class A beta-lactamase-related serine hydrolase [Flavobacteriaceae bacterium 14752]
MRNLFSKVFSLILATCSYGQDNFAENGFQDKKLNITTEQGNLIYEKVKQFPDNTQISIAIIENGKPNFFGVQRINDTLVQIDNHQDIFEIGSISKVFTSTLLAQFIVGDKLKLEDPIQEFVDLKINTKDTITLLNLTNHTSGLPRLPSNLNLFLADKNNPYKYYDKNKLKTYLSEKIKLKHKPGAQYEYSNLGAGLLGYILSKYKDSNYNTLLKESIFSKYNMSSSTANRDEVKRQLVKGLNAKGKETPNWDLNVLAGAGAILSNVEDMSKFALAQFDKNNVELQLTQKPTFEVSENMKIGLAWHIINSEKGESQFIFHNGGTGGYTSSIALDTNRKNGIIILSNVSAFHKQSREIDNLCIGLLRSQ